MANFVPVYSNKACCNNSTRLRILPLDILNVTEETANSPQLAIYQDDGNNQPIGQSVNFNTATTERVNIPANPNLNFHSGDYTIEFWFCAKTGGTALYNWFISRSGSIDIYHYKPTNIMYISIAGIGFLSFTSQVLLNQRNYFTLTYESGTGEVVVYLNNIERIRNMFVGAPLVNNNPTYVGNRFVANSAFQVRGEVDELNFWSKVLSNAERTARWNNGNGIPNADTTDLMAGYHFDNNANDYGVNGINATTDAGIDYVDGLLTATSPATFGVLAQSFTDNTNNEIFFNTILDTNYVPNSAVIAELHWTPNTDNAGDVVWSMEFTTAPVGTVIPTTTVVSKTVSSPETKLEHVQTFLPSFKVPSNSTIISVGLFRDGVNVADTYPDAVYLLSVNLRYRVFI